MKIKVLKSNSGLYLCNIIGSTSSINKYCLEPDYDLLTRWGDLIFNYVDTEDPEDDIYDLESIAREWNRKEGSVAPQWRVSIVEVDFKLIEA